MSNEVIAKSVIKKLSKMKKSLSVAESITGGGLAKTLTDIPGSSKVFILVYMNGCGPCEQTKPNWINAIEFKIDESLKDRLYIIVASIESSLISKLNNIGDIDGYPTMKYVHNTTIESYENSSVKIKDRSTHSFIDWIRSKCYTIKKDMYSLIPLTSNLPVVNPTTIAIPARRKRSHSTHHKRSHSKRRSNRWYKTASKALIRDW